VMPHRSRGMERRTDAVLLLLTSSTTGKPKVVPASASHLAARFTCNARALGVGPADRYLAVMPFHHSHGLLTVLAQLQCGGSVVYTPGFDSRHFACWWKELSPTWFSASVPLLNALAASSPADGEIFAASPPRFILVSGATPEPSLREAVERIMRASLLVGYGLTESGPAARNRPGATKEGSVGTSVGPEIAVADPLGNLLPPHQEGEIWLRGPAVISQYLDDEEATRRAFRDGWFRTGDLGRLDEDGFLFLSGRLKEIINRGSQKILPGEIDQVLASHPDLRDAASFAVPHPTLEEDVAAAVVVREGARLTEADVRRYAATRLAPFKVPRRIVFLDSIPRTASGKPQRGLLSSRDGTAAPSPSIAERPLTDVEQRIAGIWRSILRDRLQYVPSEHRSLADQPISAHDDFMALGGDSLSAACMLAEVDREFQTNGHVLTCADFFDQPSVEVLAQIVLECQTSSESNDLLLAPGILAFRGPGGGSEHDAAAMFCFPGWRGRDGGPATPYYLRHLARSLADRQPFHIVTASVPTGGRHSGSIEELARKSIEAMRAVHPRGPYVLGGHCLGGVVAFEAAQQLIAEGETVSRLMLFDAVAPGHPKMAANWAKYGSELSRVVRHLDWRDAWSHADSLIRLLNQRITGKFLRRMMRFKLGKSANATVLHGVKSVALWQYIPRSCPVPIVHFIAAEHRVSRVLDDPRYGWRDFARSGIEFLSVAGDHDSMFSPENAPALAKRIHACQTRRSA
jgi:oxalate---CoA ligase